MEKAIGIHRTRRHAPKASPTILAASLLLSLAAANDSYLGTDGGAIYPRKSTHIRMIREEISVRLGETGGEVDCKFWFVNEGADDTVYVGFPDVEISLSSASEPAKDFRAWVDGLPVPVKRDSLQEILDESDTVKSSWYYWKAFFKKADTTFIENRYSGKWGGSYCEKRFSYIIGTGNKWSGPVGAGRIVFHHGNLLSDLFIGKSIWKNPEDLVPAYFEDSTVYSFANYVPRDGETVDIWFSSYWANLHDSVCPGFYIPRDSLTRKREMVNELFARNGHIFQAAELRKKYSGKAWYKPKAKLKVSDLPRNVQFYIKNLSAPQPARKGGSG